MGMAVILMINKLKQLFEPVKPLAVGTWTFIVWQLCRWIELGWVFPLPICCSCRSVMASVETCPCVLSSPQYQFLVSRRQQRYSQHNQSGIQLAPGMTSVLGMTSVHSASPRVMTSGHYAAPQPWTASTHLVTSLPIASPIAEGPTAPPPGMFGERTTSSPLGMSAVSVPPPGMSTASPAAPPSGMSTMSPTVPSQQLCFSDDIYLVKCLLSPVHRLQLNGLISLC